MDRGHVLWAQPVGGLFGRQKYIRSGPDSVGSVRGFQSLSRRNSECDLQCRRCPGYFRQYVGRHRLYKLCPALTRRFYKKGAPADMLPTESASDLKLSVESVGK